MRWCHKSMDLARGFLARATALGACCAKALWRALCWIAGSLAGWAGTLLVRLGNLLATCATAIWRGAWSLISRFLRQVIPYFFCVWIGWRLGRRIAQEEATPALNAEMEEYMSLDLASIESAHRLELERREQLRKNAQANLAAVTVALTFIFGVFGVVSNQYLDPPSQWLGWLVRAVGAFGVLSLLMSAMSAVRALAPSRFYDMWLQTHLSSAGRMTPEGERKAKLIKAIFLNQGHTLIIANHSSASSTGMRNGVVAIGMTLLLMIICYSRTTGASLRPAGDNAGQRGNELIGNVSNATPSKTTAATPHTTTTEPKKTPASKLDEAPTHKKPDKTGIAKPDQVLRGKSDETPPAKVNDAPAKKPDKTATLKPDLLPASKTDETHPDNGK